MAVSRNARFRVIGTLLGVVTALVFKDTVSAMAGNSLFLALVFLGGTGAIVGTLFDHRTGKPRQ